MPTRPSAHRDRLPPLGPLRRALLAALLGGAGAAPHPGAWGADLNAASQAELEAVPGIGPALSARWLAARAEGAFRDVADLRRRVPGIGPVLLRRLDGIGWTLAGQPLVPGGARPPGAGRSQPDTD